MSSDLGPLSVEHPRAIAVGKACRELEDLLIRWRELHELTRVEEASLLVGYLSERMATAIARERDTRK